MVAVLSDLGVGGCCIQIGRQQKKAWHSFNIVPSTLNWYTKENEIFLIYKKFRRDRLQRHILYIRLTAFSLMVKYCIGAFPHTLGSPSSFDFAFCNWSHLNFLIYMENFVFFFISIATCAAVSAAPSLFTPFIFNTRGGNHSWP